jgi:hypothetical protein
LALKSQLPGVLWIGARLRSDQDSSYFSIQRNEYVRKQLLNQD